MIHSGARATEHGHRARTVRVLARLSGFRTKEVPAVGEFVQVETGPAAVATIRLSRPPMNALNTQVQTELRDAAEQVSSDSSVRAVVLYGGEKVFAAGAD